MNAYRGAVRRLIAAALGCGVLLCPLTVAHAATVAAETTSTTVRDTSRAVTDLALAVAPHTEAYYVDQVRAGFTPENRSYWTTHVVLDLVEVAFGIAVALILLFTKLSARIRDFANAHGRNRYTRVLIYFVVYSVIGFVVEFPLAWYGGFALEHQYHLSKQGFGGWFLDELKGFSIGIILFGVIPLVMLAYRAMEKFRRWWVALAIGSVPVVVIFTLLQPILIEPAFNKFTPLKDQVLKREILALAEKAGIPGRKVYQVDKSKQTEKFNAYVSGFGASQHLVLWDTTIRGMTHDEILYVMGHEMGHYALGHIWKGIGFFAVLSFALFFFSGLLMTWAVRRFGDAWGFHELYDIASVPLFALALSLVSLVAQPLTNAYSRSVEHQADQYGLELTHLNDAAARTFIKLGSQNKNNPEPPALFDWFEDTHPPELQRVKFAMEYHPWDEGKPNRLYQRKQ